MADRKSAQGGAVGYWEASVEVYRRSRKRNDIAWNVWIARPLAAPLVLALARTPATPNQVTFAGALVFALAIAALIAWPGAWGLAVAALLIELAYIFDCADGQLARLTGKTSPVGAYLDFLIDEFKALGLVGGFALRGWLASRAGAPWWFEGAHGYEIGWLLVGIAGVALVSVATSLTTFVRRPEYAGVEIKPGVHPARRPERRGLGRLIGLLERCAQYLIHYPSWILYLAAAAWIPGFAAEASFLVLFLGVYALYAARTGLGVVLKLGRASFYAGR